MMRMFASALAMTLALTGPALAETVVIRAGSVLTDAASEPSGPATITVTDGRIVSVAPGSPPAPVGAREVDLSGKTVLPGLIDLHVHLTSDPGSDYRNEAVEPDEWGMMVGTKNALLTLKAGFTTVREAGSAQYTGFSLRRGTAEGLIPGPRIVAAGPALSIVGGHGDVTGFREDVHGALDQGYTCTGPVECAEKVRKASRAGAD
ncbi:MAG: amidohydrolase family protein, partial [Brevundimonas sp.]|nr:amidohydrolase family protein [Brevundimonas sp.]